MLPTVSIAGLAALSLILDAPYVFAANNWDTPCLNGSCTYEAGDGNSTAYHILAINGTSSTVSDITPAAGWTISGCDANSTTGQTIQLTCDPSGANAAYCNHLLAQNPVNKVIRLPESCGAGAFARVASWSNSTNVKRNEATVQTCAFDYNFTQIPASQPPVSFSVYGSSAPGVLDNQTVSTAMETALQAQRRSFPRRGLPPRSFVSSVVNVISAAIRFREKVAVREKVIFAPGNVTVFSQSLDCDRVSEKAVITVDPTLRAQVEIAFAIQGQLAPPKVNDIALSAILSAEAQAIFDIIANVNGVIASDVIVLFSVGLPGLQVPGVFSVGPKFSISTQVKAELGASLAATIILQQTFETLDFIFPPSSGKSSLVPTNEKTTPKLAIGATGVLAGEIRADLIPKIDFDLDVLDGFLEADVFLEADLAVDLKASVSASRNLNVVDNNKVYRSLAGGNLTGVSNSSTTEVKNTTVDNSTSTGLESNPPAKSTRTNSSDVSLSGSVELDLIVDVKAGANADILTFDHSTSINIFERTTTLFQKSFGSSNKRMFRSPNGRRSHFDGHASSAVVPKRSLTCSGDLGGLDDLSVVV